MKKRFLAGFTLFELLVVLSIFVIIFLFSWGVNPQFFTKNKIDLLEKQVANSIHYSRNQAMISGQDVTLNALDKSGDWSQGMVLFIDNSTHRYAEGDHAKVLYSWHWQSSPQLRLVWQGFKSKDYLTFSGNLRRSTVNGHFEILQNGVVVRRIVINRLGRVVAFTDNHFDFW